MESEKFQQTYFKSYDFIINFQNRVNIILKNVSIQLSRSPNLQSFYQYIGYAKYLSKLLYL